MLKLVFLLHLAGLSAALQYPLEYTYSYQGSVFTGIPEIHKQAAALSIKSIVKALVQVDGTVVFKLDEDNTFYSEHHGETGCTNDEYPGDYKKNSYDNFKILTSSPFVAHLYDGSGISLETTEENLAVTNFRKALVSAFRNELLNSNFEGSSGDGSVAHKIRMGLVPPVFTVKEESLFGVCNVEYTVHKVPEFLAIGRNFELGKQVEVDVQRDQAQSEDITTKTSKKYTSKSTKKYSSKSSKKSPGKSAKISLAGPLVPKLDDTLWHVAKSIDFDHCEVSVMVPNIEFGIDENPARGQYHSLGGRSSVTEYIIRGSGGAFRVERASIQGTISSSIYGAKAEPLQIKTDQTLKLISVKEFSVPYSFPGHLMKHKRWMHEFFNPADAPEISKPLPFFKYVGNGADMSFYQYFYGYDAPYQGGIFKKMAIEHIKKISKIMVDNTGEHGLNADSSMTILRMVKFFLYTLNDKDLREVVDEIMIDPYTPEETFARKLLVDLLASQTYDPRQADMLLELLENEEQNIGQLQKLSIYMTTFSKMHIRRTLLKYMDHVLSIDIEEQPIIKSTALVNLAAALVKNCIEKVHVPSFLQTPEDVQCRAEMKAKFLPYVKSLIVSEKHWKKMLGLTILRELKTPFALQFILPFVYGEDLTLSKLAITLLEPWNNQPIIKRQAMKILETITSDIAIHPQKRQTALYALVSWEPDPQFFFKLARSTWREPSKDMVVYINAMLRALADNPSTLYKKIHHASAHAIKFVKPISPGITFGHSFLIFKMVEKLSNEFTEMKEQHWVTTKDSDEVHTTAFHMAIFNGFSVELFGMYNFMKHNLPPFEPMSRESADSFAFRIAASFYDKIQETVKADIFPNQERKESSAVYMRFLKNTRLYIPVEKEIIENLAVFDPVFQGGAAMQAMTTGFEFGLGKFVSAVDNWVFMPTDIGMPAVPYLSVMDIFAVQSSTHAEKLEDGGAKVSTDATYKELFTVLYGMQVSSAFGHSFVGTMSRSTFHLDSPVSIEYDPHKVSIDSLYENEYTLVKGENLPVTYIVKSFHEKNPFEEKVIRAMEPKETSRKISLFGLDTKMTFTSGLSSPLAILDHEAVHSFPWSMDILRPQTIRMWSLEFSFDPQTSRTRNFTFYRSSFEKEREEVGDTTQIGQEAGEFSQYGQEAGEFGQETGDFGQSSDDFGEFAGHDDFGQFAGQDDFGSQQIAQTPQEQSQLTQSDIFSELVLGESKVDRRKKLERFLEEGVKVHGVKVVADGTESHTIEILASVSQVKASTTRAKREFHLAYLKDVPKDNPLKVCLDIKKEWPKISRLSTINSVLASDLHSEMSIHMVDNCHGPPIFSIFRKSKMTEEAKENMKSRREQCPNDKVNVAVVRPNIPNVHLDQFFIYDNVDYYIDFATINNPERYPIMTKITSGLSKLSALSLGEDICRPRIDFRSELRANFHKCRCGQWHAKFGPKFGHEFKCPIINTLLDFKNSIRGTKQILDYDTPSSRNKCFISDKEITTVNEHSFDFHPTSCWTVAMTDCSFENHWMVLVREATEGAVPEVRYINKLRGVVVDIGKDIKVNGKSIDPIGESEKVEDIGIIYKNDEASLVELKDLHIAVTDKVIITVKGDKIHTCGLCGDQKLLMNTMLGPHKCMYGDPKLFADAWTGSSDRCDLYTLMAQRDQVEKYQQTCTTLQQNFDEIRSQHNTEAAVHVRWPLREEEGHYCISHLPLAFCNDGFETFSQTETEVMFNCFEKGRSPEPLVAAFENNQEYMDFAAAGTPCMKMTVNLILPDFCAKSIEPML